MKKYYVSLPISGYDLDERKLCAIYTEKQIVNRFPKPLQVITPFIVCPDSDRPYSYYMGKDIEALLECDAIFLCEGWQNSKGCMAEFEVARIYNKQILFEK